MINNLVNEGRLEQYDEIIFLNDSVFGPFYPFGEMFLKMEERKELDFWGVTKRGISDFDGEMKDIRNTYSYTFTL